MAPSSNASAWYSKPLPSKDLIILFRSLPGNRINIQLKETLCAIFSRSEGNLTPALERLLRLVKPTARKILLERAELCQMPEALDFLKSLYLRSILRGNSLRAIEQRMQRKALRDEAIEAEIFKINLQRQEKSEKELAQVRAMLAFDVEEEANSSDEVDPFGFLKDY